MFQQQVDEMTTPSTPRFPFGSYVRVTKRIASGVTPNDCLTASWTRFSPKGKEIVTVFLSTGIYGPLQKFNISVDLLELDEQRDSENLHTSYCPGSVVKCPKGNLGIVLWSNTNKISLLFENQKSSTFPTKEIRLLRRVCWADQIGEGDFVIPVRNIERLSTEQNLSKEVERANGGGDLSFCPQQSDFEYGFVSSQTRVYSETHGEWQWWFQVKVSQGRKRGQILTLPLSLLSIVLAK